MRAANGQRACGDGMRDARARSNVCAVADVDGRDQRRVGTDEDSIADGGGVLMHAVVVAGDHSRANVDALADDRVAKGREVVALGAAAKRDLLGLAEVADMGIYADIALRTKMRVGAQHRAVAHLRAIKDAAIADRDAVAEDGPLDDRVGADATITADVRRA